MKCSVRAACGGGLGLHRHSDLHFTGPKAVFPSTPGRTLEPSRPPITREKRFPMPLCFIEPQEAIRVVAESVGREARRQLLGEVVRAWVDEIPDDELESHYAKAIDELDDDDLSM